MNNNLKNKFEHLYLKRGRINILLENFTFFHRASNEESEGGIDPKYIDRNNPEHQLTNWIKHNHTGNGAYLVTGYRGAGKSSLVGKVLHQLNEEEREKTDTGHFILHVNLGQENIEEIEILRIISKTLGQSLSTLIWKDIRLHHLIEHLRDFGWILGIALGGVWIAKGSLINEYEWMKTAIFLCSILVLFYYYYHIWGKSIHMQAMERLNFLCDRLNSETSYEQSQKQEVKQIYSFSFNKKQKYKIASIQEIEYELIEIFRLLKRSKYEEKKIIIVIDELDKAETHEHQKTENEFPDYEKVSIRPGQAMTSRNRREQVLSIIANMKYFLSTANAYFIFIAGRELYEAFQSDMSDRDFTISSIFSGVINIDSFLISGRSQNNSTLMTEQFICRQILPKDFFSAAKGKPIYSYNEDNFYSLKNYYAFRKNQLKDDEETIWQDVLFLYHFMTYLSYISNGSPKKMNIFFEKHVRARSYLIGVKKEKKEKLSKKDNSFYLSFGYYTQQKINFIHYLTFPIMQSLINRSNMYGDKLLVSASFLISHIFKFHNNGFSWRNLEQTPELLEINKTPEIREYISSIIGYLNHTHLTTIPCGLYHYKFPMRITEEISYYSKMSGEISALFNFSRDEMQNIKNHYAALLSYHKNKTRGDVYALASIHHSLADIYMLEENYSQAIREFEICVELATPLLKSESDYDKQNYLLFINRSMLKLGLAHEKRRTDNSAFLVYDGLIRLLKKTLSEMECTEILFQDMRTMHLAILAKLYVLEKIDTDGIKRHHVKQAIEDFEELFLKKIAACNAPQIIQSDFYRKLGDILYYKNSNKLNAYPCYVKSIQKLLNNQGNKKKNQLCLSIFSEIEQKKTNWRDNFVYSLALSCESLGHISFADRDNHACLEDNRKEFYNDFMKYIDSKDLLVEKEKIETGSRCLVPVNNVERAIMYYWAASRLYNASCERGLSSRCFKQILNVFATYTNTLLQKDQNCNSSVWESLLEFVDVVARHFLIANYRQYEHIHLAEINSLKWTKGTELYEYISIDDLSISPDIEELLYTYYTLKLLLATKLKGTETDELRVSCRESVIKFYTSRLMTGKHFCNTLTSSVLNLRLKTRINEFLLAQLLNVGVTAINDVEIELFYSYLDNDISSEWIKAIFPKVNDCPETKLDALEYLIVDGLFCLSYILEIVVPNRDTTLFNNSFKADIYFHMTRFNHLYKLLYCYYSLNMDDETNAKIETYLERNRPANRKASKRVDINCTTNQRESDELKGALLTVEEQKGKTGLCIVGIHHENINFVARKTAFIKAIFQATRHSTPANTLRLYLVENAIHYYTKARQVHSEGKSYQEIIRNLHFLDDDLNNDTCQFYMAQERYALADKCVKSREDILKEQNGERYPYSINKYFIEGE